MSGPGIGQALVLAGVLALLAATPSFAPLKQAAGSDQAVARMAVSGLHRSGLIYVQPHTAEVRSEALARDLACARQGLRDPGSNVDAAQLALAIRAVEAVSRPLWRQKAEVLLARTLRALTGRAPNLSVGPLQLRASLAPRLTRKIAPSMDRLDVMDRLTEPCIALGAAAHLLEIELRRTVGAGETARVLKAAARYSGYLGDPYDYRYGSVALAAYRIVGEMEASGRLALRPPV